MNAPHDIMGSICGTRPAAKSAGGILEEELAAERRRERSAVADDWKLYRDAVRDAWRRIRNG